MRLIHTTRFEICEFFGADIPVYAILSHCWGDDEVSYQDFIYNRNRRSQGHKKISQGCTLAQLYRLEWIWIDTCCIDKTSSVELSEAINSMFNWYQRARVCFVLLSDYQHNAEVQDEATILTNIRDCRWFSRGWTLQELLAPLVVLFYDNDLQLVGNKIPLAGIITKVTGIPVAYLTQRAKLYEASIAQKMSWASSRKTSRIEDIAYCLLGIFQVNMPLLYGEGRRAFRRLQHQIISQFADESIFAWRSTRPTVGRAILADNPSDFRNSGEVIMKRRFRREAPWIMTSKGLEIHAQVSAWGPLFTALNHPKKPFLVDMPLNCELLHLDELGRIIEREGMYLQLEPAKQLDKHLWQRYNLCSSSTRSVFPFERYLSGLYMSTVKMYIIEGDDIAEHVTWHASRYDFLQWSMSSLSSWYLLTLGPLQYVIFFGGLISLFFPPVGLSNLFKDDGDAIQRCKAVMTIWVTLSLYWKIWRFNYFFCFCLFIWILLR